MRDILFEIFSKTEIRNRFDKSNDFWKRFNVHDANEQKVLRLYEVENIEDPCHVTLSVNPKEYLEYFKSHSINKKRKGIKKGSAVMEYENYAERIKPLIDFNTYKKPKVDVKSIGRISVKKGEMTARMIRKNKFLQLKNKRFYFPNAVVSVPLGHLSLSEIDGYKKNKCRKIEKYFWTKKEKLFELEKSARRIDHLNNILAQVPKIVNVNCIKFDNFTNYLYIEEQQQNILEYILQQGWKTSTPSMENSLETS